MKGLRIRNRLSELIAPISQLVTDYFWVLDNVMFVHQSAGGSLFDERKYSESILQESQPLVLIDKDSLLEFAEFIQGDWDSIYGLRGPVDLAGFAGLGCGTLPGAVEIYFSCVDAAYWEVFARDEELLRLMKWRFPDAEECSLGEKQY